MTQMTQMTPIGPCAIRPSRHIFRAATMTASPLVPPELLSPVVGYFNPRRVILFGSHARGQAGPDSDIDLLVIVDDDTPPEKVRLRAGFEARRSYHEPADIVPVREETFRRKSLIPGTLSRAASLEGIVVYERPRPAGGQSRHCRHTSNAISQLSGSTRSPVLSVARFQQIAPDGQTCGARSVIRAGSSALFACIFLHLRFNSFLTDTAKGLKQPTWIADDCHLSEPLPDRARSVQADAPNRL